jgi:hypothetical protein
MLLLLLFFGSFFFYYFLCKREQKRKEDEEEEEEEENKNNNLFRKEQGNMCVCSKRQIEGNKESGNDRLDRPKLHYKDTEEDEEIYM